MRPVRKLFAGNQVREDGSLNQGGSSGACKNQSDSRSCGKGELIEFPDGKAKRRENGGSRVSGLSTWKDAVTMN